MFDYKKEEVALESLLAYNNMQIETLESIYNEIKHSGVNKSIMLSLESVAPDAISEQYPINSFTENKTSINKTIAMEGIVRSIFTTIKNGLVAIYEFILKGLKWIYELFTGKLKKGTEHQLDALTMVNKLLDKGKLEVNVDMYNKHKKHGLVNYIEDYKDKLEDSEKVRSALGSTYTDISNLLNVLMDALEEINYPLTTDMALNYERLKARTSEIVLDLWQGEKIASLYSSVEDYAKSVGVDVNVSITKSFNTKELNININTQSYSLEALKERYKAVLKLAAKPGIERNLTKDNIIAIYKSKALDIKDELETQKHVETIVAKYIKDITNAKKEAERTLMEMTSVDDPIQKKLRTFIEETKIELSMFHTLLTTSVSIISKVSDAKNEMVTMYATSMVKI